MAEPLPLAFAAGDAVLALEPRAVGGAPSSLQSLDPLRPLADLAVQTRAPMLLRLDPHVVRSFTTVLDLVGARQVTVLPCIVVDAEPGGIAAQLDCLRALDEKGAIALQNGIAYAGILADSGHPIEDIASEVARLLERPQRPVRIGGFCVRSPHMKIPPGANFMFDWPPYRAVSDLAGEPVVQDYAEVALQVARRHAGLGPVVPSVLAAAGSTIHVPGAGVRVTNVSPIKVEYAIEAARRFVHNRIAHGPGFWLLRVALSDDDHVSRLAALLRRPRAALPDGAPGPAGLPPRGARIAAVVHLFFPEVWPDLADAIAAIPEPVDVFVSCPLRARAAVERMVRAGFPAAVVFGVQNRGRDVLPFLGWLRTPGIERYEYVLKLHSKKSTHIAESGTHPAGHGKAWRQRAIGGLVVDGAQVAGLLRGLDAARDVGLVAPTGLLYDQATWECSVGDVLATLRERYGIPGPLEGSFPAGTMFWARTDALALLRNPPAAAIDFEPEAGQVDGGLHHAYERLFPFAAAARGYRTVAADQLGA